MDIVIEGKITPEEGVAEIIQTVLDLKNVPNAVLRLTSTEDSVQGRIGFGQGGYILGGRVNVSEETGYPAVRRLLAIQQGTYAILDPGKTPLTDVNQTLWINATKVVDLIPNLPESPHTLMEGGDPNAINTVIDKAQLDPMDLKNARHDKADIVAGKKSRARSFDLAGWRMFRMCMLVLGAVAISVGLVHYWDQIIAVFQPH